MKALIWIAVIVIGTILNYLLGSATGIKAGAFALYIVEFFVARRLCEKWDEHIKQKSAEEDGGKNEN